MLGTNAEFSRRLLKWYARFRRDLPWRSTSSSSGEGRPSQGQSGPVDPYYVLVSETMLQQTQVATVVPYFRRFLERFPTLTDLARAEEREILRLWQGLGYYSRARNLQAAARRIVEAHAGKLPETVEALLELPGVGRYTAGAISSIAFGRRAPILDGNVTRVICRLDEIAENPRDAKVQRHLWRRAEELLPRKHVGDFNSALMELGATVCTPRNPQCLICPVRPHCRASRSGTQDRIPLPKKSAPTPLFRRRVWCILRGDEWLIEQRPAKGRWAGLWQFVTRDADEPGPLPVPISNATPIGEVSHALTHRRYHFEVLSADAELAGPKISDPRLQWVTLDGLAQYPLPRPHLRIVQLLRSLEKSEGR